MFDAVTPLSEDLLMERALGEHSRDLALLRRNRVLAVAAPLLLLALWQILAALRILDATFFSSPVRIFAYFADDVRNFRLFGETGKTLFRVVIGFLLGAPLGLVLGIAMGLSSWVNAITRPLIRVTYPIPHASLLPLVLVIFGKGEVAGYVIAALGAFYNMLITSAAAVQSVERIHIEVARNLGVSRTTMFFNVLLPSALPEIFSGIRLAWGAALLLIVIVEFVGSGSGLGFRIWRSWQLFAIEPMFVGLCMVGLVAFGSYAILNHVQRLVVPWRR